MSMLSTFGEIKVLKSVNKLKFWQKLRKVGKIYIFCLLF
jgi:hypothetical protein